MGKAVPASAFHDDAVGRVLARLDDFGTMTRFPAWAGRAAARFGVERCSGHVETTSRRVWGDSQCAEAHDLPFQVTDGSSQEKRPDLKPFVLSTLGVDRAVPMWGKPEDGHAADTTRNPTRLAEITQLLARDGVQPGASLSMADAALVTADNLAALANP